MGATKLEQPTPDDWSRFLAAVDAAPKTRAERLRAHEARELEQANEEYRFRLVREEMEARELERRAKEARRPAGASGRRADRPAGRRSGRGSA